MAFGPVSLPPEGTKKARVLGESQGGLEEHAAGAPTCRGSSEFEF